LQRLHETYGPQGFEVLAFPCNQFAQQEPSSIAEIEAFVQKTYGVTFRVYDKIDVNGSRSTPLFEFLKQHAPGILGTESIKWNFTKVHMIHLVNSTFDMCCLYLKQFLCDVNGTPFKRYGPMKKPQSLVNDIELLLRYKTVEAVPPSSSCFSCFASAASAHSKGNSISGGNSNSGANSNSGCNINSGGNSKSNSDSDCENPPTLCLQEQPRTPPQKAV
jgi:glutathione peroxidase